MPFCSLCTRNRIRTTKPVVKRELEIITAHGVCTGGCVASFGSVTLGQTRFLSCSPCCAAPMCSHVTAPAAGYKKPPNKVYFNGKASPVQLASAPVSAFACATLEDCPRKARGGRGTAPASPVVLQEMNLPVCYPPQFYLGRAWLPAES